ncbi:glycosyltransferase [Confluentibacter sediminis]|uniref:glycosyltransferase n=1 Tax=Confluentibacter sediminis TaxID=2219045 RepID=UPI0013A6E0AD|nr:glycosyltransferase [Confluentibacter sediminis]
MKRLAPICLFTYNRLSETQQTVAALQQNFLAKESDLFIFSDGAKIDDGTLKIKEVRTFLKNISGFKSVTLFESKKNKGLANSIIDGVTKLLLTHESVIVLEDDLITTPNFLDFMNQALEYYKADDTIYTINGYSPLIKNMDLDTFYLHSRCFPWGWATWKKNWNKAYFDKENIRKHISLNSNVLPNFDKYIGDDASYMLLETLNNKINSWYIRWVFNNYLENKKSIFPVLSKVQNIGDTKEATNYSGGISAYYSVLDNSHYTSFDFSKTIILNKTDSRFLKYFSKKHKFLHRLRMLSSRGGVKKLTTEIKTKIFK